MNAGLRDWIDFVVDFRLYFLKKTCVISCLFSAHNVLSENSSALNGKTLLQRNLFRFRVDPFSEGSKPF